MTRGVIRGVALNLERKQNVQGFPSHINLNTWRRNTRKCCTGSGIVGKDFPSKHHGGAVWQSEAVRFVRKVSCFDFALDCNVQKRQGTILAFRTLGWG